MILKQVAINHQLLLKEEDASKFVFIKDEVFSLLCFFSL
jgi:hypothetical protein